MPRFRPLAQLFVSATTDLADVFEELHEQVEANFDTGGGRDAYLRSRGLLNIDAAGLADADTPIIGDDFLVAGKLPLGVCMDLIAEFLDALDGTFDLYPNQTPKAPTGADTGDSRDVA